MSEEIIDIQFTKIFTYDIKSNDRNLRKFVKQFT